MIDSLKKLEVDHDYYCSGSNFYSNDPACNWTTWADFYEEYFKADIDMNLIFRWDIHKREESGRYYASIFMIHQRKGIFAPHLIEYIDEQDLDSFKKLMRMHWEKLESIWRPLNYPSWMSEFEASTELK